MMSTDIILEVNNVTKKYKDFTLNNISFSLPEGFILGLIGKNGAGKTTLMNCLIGCIDYQGEVIVDGFVNTIHERLASDKIGFIVEKGPFLAKETLLENGELFGRFYKDFDEGKFLKLLLEFGLCYDTEYGELSKGMETKFQLTFALAHSPKLLVLDEPTGGLDPSFRRTFLNILQTVVEKENISIIISTHLTMDLDKVADYIMMLDGGEMVFFEDKERLLDKYPLVSGNVEILKDIPKTAYTRVRKNGNIFQTIFTDLEYIKENESMKEKLQIQRTNLEEIMYFFSVPTICF